MPPGLLHVRRLDIDVENETPGPTRVASSTRRRLHIGLENETPGPTRV